MNEIEARVREMIRASDIPAEVAAALQDSLRYSIRMHTVSASDDELALGTTKIGGQPDLPQDTPWPEWRSAPLNFLAQIRLADVARIRSRWRTATRRHALVLLRLHQLGQAGA